MIDKYINIEKFITKLSVNDSKSESKLIFKGLLSVSIIQPNKC